MTEGKNDVQCWDTRVNGDPLHVPITMPLYIQDKRLSLAGNRVVAYADSGNTSSSIVVLFLHGIFGVGDASRLCPTLVDKRVHFVAPSLPGWGGTSPVADPTSYAATIVADIRALLSHLHPEQSSVKLYISGLDIGCIAAQILYGASYSDFPIGRNIAGLVLIAPISPPHCHKDYSSLMSWWEYLLIGPPSRYIPFNLLARTASLVLARRLASQSAAETLARRILFDPMTETEHAIFSTWKEAQGVADGQLEKEYAANMVRSVAVSWRGFLDIPLVYHSGWGGFCPYELDDEHSRPPVSIVAPSNTPMSSIKIIDWLRSNYQNVTTMMVPGGHITTFLSLEHVWKNIII